MTDPTSLLLDIYISISNNTNHTLHLRWHRPEDGHYRDEPPKTIRPGAKAVVHLCDYLGSGPEGSFAYTLEGTESLHYRVDFNVSATHPMHPGSYVVTPPDGFNYSLTGSRIGRNQKLSLVLHGPPMTFAEFERDICGTHHWTKDKKLEAEYFDYSVDGAEFRLFKPHCHHEDRDDEFSCDSQFRLLRSGTFQTDDKGLFIARWSSKTGAFKSGVMKIEISGYDIPEVDVKIEGDEPVDKALDVAATLLLGYLKKVLKDEDKNAGRMRFPTELEAWGEALDNIVYPRYPKPPS